MSNKREKAELHNTIWKTANELRGSVDGWDFKAYVLGMLFYRFISENITKYINGEQHKAGFTDFDYAKFDDEKSLQQKDSIVKAKGFFIKPSDLFENVKNNALTDENLNVTLSNVFKNIENSANGTEFEDDIKGLFDDIKTDSNKLGSTVAEKNNTLRKILNTIGDMKMGDYQDNTIDVFGDAYEFLMGMYAANAGKSGGEYYTPQEVSELLAMIAADGKTEVNKVYDPACGSGSLLLKFAKILGKENVKNGFYGQEINLTTYNLARINMFLHDINPSDFNIAHGNTLTNPLHLDDEPFESIVSNPPYSIKWEGKNNKILESDPRFRPAGVLAPVSKADFAFVMHILSHLATNGTAAIVEFPGVLTRGGAEQKIRKYLMENNYISAVIQLPENLFFGTSIATCIIVLKKNKTNTKTLFVDASGEFKRETKKNTLTNKNIQKIYKTVFENQENEYFSRLVDIEEIRKNDYLLSVSTYVEKEDTTEKIDIKELNASLKEIVKKQSELRKEIDKIVAQIEAQNAQQ